MSVLENGWCIVKNVSFGSQLPSFDSPLVLHYIHKKTRKTRLQCPHL